MIALPTELQDQMEADPGRGCWKAFELTISRISLISEMQSITFMYKRKQYCNMMLKVTWPILFTVIRYFPSLKNPVCVAGVKLKMNTK